MSFLPLYKLHRAVPTANDKLLLIDRQGRACLEMDETGRYIIPDAGNFPELCAAELPELGNFRGKSCYGCRLQQDTLLADKFTLIDVREALMQVDPAVKNLLLRGKPILEWLAQRKYCSVCGAELVDHEQEEARYCPNCRMLFFPKISPAVIVLIKRQDGKILLAHNCKFRHKVYSLIAGFVEAGETAEDAVRREVREEVGLEIKNIQYKYSQSWPFPDSLMLGFTAEYASGELTPDGEEIVDANFYSLDDLPPLPGHGSIARRIIEEYIAENKN
jgi:NAD+ diphosphatase